MNYWIEQLKLLPHPEGGYYRETYRAKGHIVRPTGEGTRNFSTAIYFLLQHSDRSKFHRIQSDEIWHFHAGGRLTIYVLTDKGLETHTLGTQLEQGDQLQIVIPAQHWFGAIVSEGDYVLAGCTVSPGFDFADFELADTADLLRQFPGEADIIRRLT